MSFSRRYTATQSDYNYNCSQSIMRYRGYFYRAKELRGKDSTMRVTSKMNKNFMHSVIHTQKHEHATIGILKPYFCTLITQKAHRIYKHILEGADVGVIWLYIVEETRVPGENHQPWTGDHYPAKCTIQTPNWDLVFVGGSQ